jgi:hypothetical protein
LNRLAHRVSIIAAPNGEHNLVTWHKDRPHEPWRSNAPRATSRRDRPRRVGDV